MTRLRAMPRLGRAAIAVPGLAALAMGSVLVAPASAQAEVSCGDEITQDTTLTQDLGPCPGNGLIVTADNVTLDLNGHTITGPHGSDVQEQAGEAVGINLRGVSGVTVQNGEVHNFDAGVAMGNSTRNTVQGMNVHHNINHGALQDEAEDNPCNFGDGIALVNSSDNRIAGNRIASNGPLSGVALIYNSDGNEVVRNQVVDNNIRALNPAGESILCGTGDDQGPMGSGREVQNVGIRVEGPGAEDNRIAGNEVTNNALAGVAVHGWVCGENDAGAPITSGNDNTTIQNNRISETGATTGEDDPHAHGIAMLATGPATVVCVSDAARIIGNDSSNNFGHGVFVGGRGSSGHQINANSVNGNGADGIHLQAPASDEIPGVVDSRINDNDATGSGGFDGFDGTPGCDNNQWRGNQFGDVNQACVSGPGQ
ncbi:MAG: hypothetical protein GEU83_07070 [Pseudonocardiaceae bacterium]|nr:hypothetical protein [Pseudonocardiaceae bacterium]